MPGTGQKAQLADFERAGLDCVSGGRFTLGLGTSGPQVIEGWQPVFYFPEKAAVAWRWAG